MDLTDMPSRFEGSNGAPHNGDLFWSVVDLLDCNGWGVARIDDTFIVLDGYPDPAVVEY